MGPNTTVQTSFNAGAIVTAVTEIAAATGHPVPAGVVAGATTLLIALVGYFWPHPADSKGTAQ